MTNLHTSLEHLRISEAISQRTYNCLKNAGISDLEQLHKSYPNLNDLLRIDNFGRKCLEEIKTVFYKMQNGYENLWDDESLHTNLFVSRIRDLERLAYDETLSKYASSTTVNVKEVYPDVTALHTELFDPAKTWLPFRTNLTEEGNTELRRFCKDFVDGFNSLLKEHGLSNEEVYKQTERLQEKFGGKLDHYSLEYRARYFLSPSCREFIQHEYERLSEPLGVRTQHVIRDRVPRFEDAVRLFGRETGECAKILNINNRSKVMTEFHQFINRTFHDLFMEVSVMSDDEILRRQQERQYPFLRDEERAFVSDFYKGNGHLPFFFMGWKYVCRSDNRHNVMIGYIYGFSDGTAKNYNDTAEKFNRTRERVRQIDSKGIDWGEANLVGESSLAPYSGLLAHTFINEDSECYLTIKADEHLDCCYLAFARLLCDISRQWTIFKINGRRVLLNTGLVTEEAADRLVKRIVEIKKIKTSKDIWKPMDGLIFTDEETTPEIRDFAVFALGIYGIETSPEGMMKLSQNHINIPEELCAMLEASGKPMKLEELFLKFKEKYPDHKYTDANDIRPSIQQHKKIRPIGNTSTYGLEGWNLYYGSIRDLMIETLDKSDVPLCIEDIYEKVTVHYPQTNINSIRTSMQTDYASRFIEFKGHLFGLAGKAYPETFIPRTIRPKSMNDSFVENFVEFRNFVDKHHRFPLFAGDEDETFLYRWQHNVESGNISMTLEQKEEFRRTVETYTSLEYPRTASEYEFLKCCDRYKDFITRNHAVPTPNTDPELYNWYRKARARYNKMDELRRKRMKELTDFIYANVGLGLS